jgi:type IV pilus assembly protein PilW
MNNSLTRLNRCAPSGQRGFTLIEIAIAMTIGLFLLAGVSTLVSSVRITSGTQNQMAQLQDNERLAMTLMTDVIEAAGYFPDPKTYGLLDFPAAGSLAQGQAITGTSGPDTITVRYETKDDGLINCLGASNPVGAAALVYTNKFSVSAQGQLQCEVNGVNGGLPVPLVDGIESMTIWYGVTTAPVTPSQTCTDSYMTATQVTAGGYWNNVCSIRVTLVFTNKINPASGPISFSRVIAVMKTAGANT